MTILKTDRDKTTQQAGKVRGGKERKNATAFVESQETVTANLDTDMEAAQRGDYTHPDALAHTQ